jgi:phenylpyruvate tautomerase PptA (4-oxalocrotonate tautomerase family)
MGQVKIYGLTENINKNRKKLSDAIHESIVESLEFPADKRFHRFIKLSEDDFIFPDSRSSNYLIIEIIMFEGRSDTVKRILIKNIYKKMKLIGIENNDIEITLIEEPPKHWGIRGQIGDELKVNYKIEI